MVIEVLDEELCLVTEVEVGNNIPRNVNVAGLIYTYNEIFGAYILATYLRTDRRGE